MELPFDGSGTGPNKPLGSHDLISYCTHTLPSTIDPAPPPSSVTHSPLLYTHHRQNKSVSDFTGEKTKRGGGGAGPEGVKERAVLQEEEGGRKKGKKTHRRPRKTNSSQRRHYLHKSVARSPFLLFLLPVLLLHDTHTRTTNTLLTPSPPYTHTHCSQRGDTPNTQRDMRQHPPPRRQSFSPTTKHTHIHKGGITGSGLFVFSSSAAVLQGESDTLKS